MWAELMTVDAELWIYGGDDHWMVKYPVCAECGPDAIRAIPRTFVE
jgi:hypothetical protein